jgi:hypothetical protein
MATVSRLKTLLTARRAKVKVAATTPSSAATCGLMGMTSSGIRTGTDDKAIEFCSGVKLALPATAWSQDRAADTADEAGTKDVTLGTAVAGTRWLIAEEVHNAELGPDADMTLTAKVTRVVPTKDPNMT